MTDKTVKIEHYKHRLKQIEKKIRTLTKKSPIIQSGGISNRYLYLLKIYENAYKRLKALKKEVEVLTIEDIEITLNIDNTTKCTDVQKGAYNA